MNFSSPGLVQTNASSRSRSHAAAAAAAAFSFSLCRLARSRSLIRCLPISPRKGKVSTLFALLSSCPLAPPASSPAAPSSLPPSLRPAFYHSVTNPLPDPRSKAAVEK